MSSPRRTMGAMAELFPFRFFDPIRNRWIQARYQATLEEIAARYARWEITGPGWTPTNVEGRSNRAGDAAHPHA